MKRYHFFSLAAISLLLSFLLFSCSQDDVTPIQPKLLDDITLISQLRDKAYVDWNAVKGRLEEPVVSTENVQPRRHQCNCSYRIIDFEYSTFAEVSNGGYPASLEPSPIKTFFWSRAKCFEGDFEENLDICNLFTGVYSSGPPREDDKVAVCYDQWETLPPRGRFKFNCKVPSFSVFPVAFGILVPNLSSWKITFEINCRDANPVQDAGQKNEYGYVSRPITLSYPGNAQGKNWGQTYVQLRGGGCVPEEVAFH